MSITAADVKKLRETTGAGMMDCKKALGESGGDFEGAIEILRKKGQKLSAKRADREATEGVVIAKVNADRTSGIVVKLGCETDFVAKNTDFVAFADQIADLALTNLPDSAEALLALDFNGMALGDKITEQIGVIGEKVEVSSYAKLTGAQVVPYIHMGNKAGVIVSLSKAGDAFEQAGKDVAMQVAAMKPVAVDKDGVDSEIVEKEIEIGKEIARNEGKPEEMLEKIAMGKLNRFYKDNTLLNQIFVKDGKKTVQQYLNDIEDGLTVTDFKHLMLG